MAPLFVIARVESGVSFEITVEKLSSLQDDDVLSLSSLFFAEFVLVFELLLYIILKRCTVA